MQSKTGLGLWMTMRARVASSGGRADLGTYSRGIRSAFVAAVAQIGRAQAVPYALNQWQALCRYTQDGRLTIDNNVSERRLRDQAIGRKNWLFLGNDEAGSRAAVLCTIIAGAKRHRLEPLAYLREVILQLSVDSSQEFLETLLPDRWALAHPEHVLNHRLDESRQKRSAGISVASRDDVSPRETTRPRVIALNPDVAQCGAAALVAPCQQAGVAPRACPWESRTLTLFGRQGAAWCPRSRWFFGGRSPAGGWPHWARSRLRSHPSGACTIASSDHTLDAMFGAITYPCGGCSRSSISNWVIRMA